MTRNDLKRQFPDVFTQAQALLDAGSATISGQSADGEKFFGLVDDGRRTHRLLVRIPSADNRIAEGECSCGAKQACVHLCALLLLHLSGQRPSGQPLESDPVAANERRKLIYSLKPDPNGIHCRTQLVVEDDGGHWQRRLDFRYQPNSRRPRFLLQDDEALLADLEECSYRLTAEEAPLLSRLLQSGRCHLTGHETPLRQGRESELDFSWQASGNGDQTVRWSCPAGDELLLFPKPWYLDRRRRLCGPARSPLPDPLLNHLNSHRWIRPLQLDAVRRQLRELAGDTDIPLPEPYPVEQRQGKDPQPVLRIGPYPGNDSGDLLQCLLLFEYDGILLPDPGSDCCLQQGRIVCIERNRQAEQHRLDAIASLYPPNLNSPYERQVGLKEWRRQGPGMLAGLRAKGWQIDFREGFEHSIVFADEWYGHIDQTAEGWFDLSVGIKLADEQVNLVPILQQIVQSDDTPLSPEGLQRMADDRVIGIDWNNGQLALPAARLKPLLATLFELYREPQEQTGSIRLDAVRAASYRMQLEEDRQSPMQWREPEALARLREQLQKQASIDSAMPEGLRAELRDYQRQGLNWLQFLEQHGIGGILADDMGLGKTLQTLAWLLWQKQQGDKQLPSLVVAPTSLLGNWRSEAKRFTPALKVLVLHGPKRISHFCEIPDRDLVVTSYPLLVRDQTELANYRYRSLVLDEAQWIKNPASKTAGAVRALQADNGLCLTGTPLENHLGEFWALFDFLMPGFLGGPNLFQRLVRNPIEKQGDVDTAIRLARRVRPFLLRRTKQQVLEELPPKTEIERHIELEGDQRDLYETIRSIMHRRVRDVLDDKGMARSHITILDALLKLRQVCCDPRLVKLQQARGVENSVKLDYLRLQLPELIDEGRRILLFSQFTSMLELIEQEVQKLEIGYVKLTGQTRDRDHQIRRFESAQVPLFLISLKAGGVGLNLTSADTVIHYDPWWNPAVERQATDRAHRIGQDKPVFVYKLLCEGTVESRIRDMQQRKQALADGLFEAGGKPKTTWSENDLEVLFAPLEEM